MASQCKRSTVVMKENTSLRVSSPSVCRTGAPYLPKQTSLVLHFGFNLTGSPMPTPAGVCHCLTHLGNRSCLEGHGFQQSPPSTTLYHDIAAGKHSLNTGFAVPMGWRCSFSPLPDTGLLKFKAGTQHISMVRNLHCVISA